MTSAAPDAQPAAAIRSRVRELRHVPASSLQANPKNWRRHPQFQIEALRAALDRIGFSAALLARELPDGSLRILDGHLRASLHPDTLVPVLILDLDEDESDFLLATLDPIAALAHADGDLLQSLLDELQVEEDALQKLFARTMREADYKPSFEESRLVPPFYHDDQIVDAAFTYYRERGFPYRKLPRHRCMQDINALAASDVSALFNTKVGIAVADTYHPHRFHAHAFGMRAPYDSFHDDKRLRQALRLEIDAKNGAIGDEYLGAMNLVQGTQACSNFRPGFAAAIYRAFCPPDATVLDTSTGYGGRLVGFIASGCAGLYIGIEPNVDTHNGNLKMAGDLDFADHVQLMNLPAEDVPHEAVANTCDFAFTSPPYFGKEIYSDAATQSFARFPTWDAWTTGFLVPMCRLQFAALKPQGIAALNVSDINVKQQRYPLVEATKQAALAAGFNFLRIEEYGLQRRFGGWEEERAVEPVLIFRKP